MVSAGFSEYTDWYKAMETANEVTRVVIELKECCQPAQLYIQRVRLISNMQVCVAMEIHCSR